GWMARSGFAPGWIGGATNGMREPDPSAGIQHRVVQAGLARPDDVLAPVGRRRQVLLRVGVLSVRVANRHLHTRCRIAHRVEDVDIGLAESRNAVDVTVGVEGRIALVGRNRVVDKTYGSGPVP